MVTVALVAMTASSPATGTIPPSQLEGAFQSPELALVHVRVVTAGGSSWAERLRNG
jgi:hypothetical protein